jgi:hypothetical protein
VRGRATLVGEWAPALEPVQDAMATCSR